MTPTIEPYSTNLPLLSGAVASSRSTTTAQPKPEAYAEVWRAARIDWMYPNIYPEKPLDAITISMFHARGSENLKIEFDGDRDGFVIRMDRVRWRDGVFELLAENVEVAFLPAYNEEEECSE